VSCLSLTRFDCVFCLAANRFGRVSVGQTPVACLSHDQEVALTLGMAYLAYWVAAIPCKGSGMLLEFDQV
jgi:hypothetical protein